MFFWIPSWLRRWPLAAARACSSTRSLPVPTWSWRIKSETRRMAPRRWPAWHCLAHQHTYLPTSMRHITICLTNYNTGSSWFCASWVVLFSSRLISAACLKSSLIDLFNCSELFIWVRNYSLLRQSSCFQLCLQNFVLSPSGRMPFQPSISEIYVYKDADLELLLGASGHEYMSSSVVYKISVQWLSFITESVE